MWRYSGRGVKSDEKRGRRVEKDLRVHGERDRETENQSTLYLGFN